MLFYICLCGECIGTKKQAARSDGPKYCSRFYCRRRRYPEEGNSRPARIAHTIINTNISQGTREAAIIKIKMPQINTPNIICDPRLKRETSYKHYCTCERRPAVNVAAYVYTINIINIFMVKNDTKTFVRHNELHKFKLKFILECFLKCFPTFEGQRP